MLYQFSILDIVPYLAVWLILCILLLQSSRQALFLGALTLCVFSSIRYGIGYDYPNYLKLIEGDHTHIEWLSRALMDFSIHIGHPQIYFIVNTLICILPIVYVCNKLSYNPCLSLFIYALIPLFFIDSMSIVRNSSAYSILFLGGYFLMNQRYLKSVICAVLAIGLHSSSYIFIILYFIILLKNRFSYKFNLLIYFIAAIFMFFDFSYLLVQNMPLLGFIPDSLAGKVEAYAGGLMDQGRFIKFIWFFIGFVNLVFIKKISARNSFCFLFFTLYNVGLLIWSFFNFDHTLSLRLSTFFFLYLILLIPAFLSLPKRYVLSMRTLIVVFFTLFAMSSFYVNISSYNNSDKNYNKISFLPYQTIFSYTKYSNYQ